jgi:hypothetical protein
VARVIVRFRLDKQGIAACAVGPELRHAVHDIAATALPFAELFSPVQTGEYARSWEIVDTIVDDIGKPPMPRVAAQLANTSDHAILVEVGNGTPNGTEHRVLRHVLDVIDALGRNP